MSEADWLACDDPARMLEVAMGHSAEYCSGHAPAPSGRKLRLFVCGIARRIWRRLTDERSRKAVEAAERYADRLADRGELVEAAYGAAAARSFGHPVLCPEWLAHVCAAPEPASIVEAVRRQSELVRLLAPPLQAAMLRDIVGNPFTGPHLRRDKADSLRLVSGSSSLIHAAMPWLTPTVRSLARLAYEDRPSRKCGECEGTGSRPLPDRLSFGHCKSCRGAGEHEGWSLDALTLSALADAMEEAGAGQDFDSQRLLWHLRGIEPCRKCLGARAMSLDAIAHEPEADGCDACQGKLLVPLAGPHVRGCWATDLVLGKE